MGVKVSYDWVHKDLIEATNVRNTILTSSDYVDAKDRVESSVAQNNAGCEYLFNVVDVTEKSFLAHYAKAVQEDIPQEFVSLTNYLRSCLALQNERVKRYKEKGARNNDEYGRYTGACDIPVINAVVLGNEVLSDEDAVLLSQCMTLSQVTDCFFIVIVSCISFVPDGIIDKVPLVVKGF